jgi:predicted nucleic acid-binding protein
MAPGVVQLMTFKILIDTCVWLDLAKDYRQAPTIRALQDLSGEGKIEIVVPRIVVDEFERNRPRVIAEAQRGLQSHFRLVRDAVERFGDEAEKASTLNALSEIDHRIITKGEGVHDSIDRIEEIFGAATIVETSDAVKCRVADRALTKLAPFHRSKNSVADAALIEIYADLLAATQERKLASPSSRTTRKTLAARAATTESTMPISRRYSRTSARRIGRAWSTC